MNRRGFFGWLGAVCASVFLPLRNSPASGGITPPVPGMVGDHAPETLIAKTKYCASWTENGDCVEVVTVALDGDAMARALASQMAMHGCRAPLVVRWEE